MTSLKCEDDIEIFGFFQRVRQIVKCALKTPNLTMMRDAKSAMQDIISTQITHVLVSCRNYYSQSFNSTAFNLIHIRANYEQNLCTVC